MTNVDVIVIGAGLSGLAAGRVVGAAGLRLVVLEARDRVGGLTYSPHNSLLGERIDLGGQWISKAHSQMFALVERYGVRMVPQYLTGDRVRLHGDTVHRTSGDTPWLTPAAAIEQKASLEALYREFEDIEPDPWLSPRASELDSMTFASWAARTAESASARSSLMRMTSAFIGARAEEISALDALQRLKCAGGPIFMSDPVTGAQSFHLIGSARVSEGMADEIGNVKLSAAVREVKWSNEEVHVTTDAGTYQARRLICAIPPALINRIAFTPALPMDKRQLLQKFPGGRYTKALLAYREQFWRAEGLSGNIFPGDDTFTAFYDMGDETGAYPVLAGLFGGAAALRFDRLSPAGRREEVIGLAVRAFGPKAATPLDYADKVWADDEWSSGGSSSFLAPGAIVAMGAGLRSANGPIHWAGGYMAPEYPGYMEGAVRSGEAAARAVVRDLSG